MPLKETAFKRAGAAENFRPDVRMAKRFAPSSTGARQCGATRLKSIEGRMAVLSTNRAFPTLPSMNNAPRDPRHDKPKKNPTRAVSVFIVVVVLIVIGTVLFNAIREKREFDRDNAQPSAASDVRPAVPAIGASQ
ncbi:MULTISPECIES: hypothetical protein [Caballeronia]|uniref:hypothetical protein n=1 Tax=Caballeronia TaxID=1827195 RepID=UPI0002387A7E|nr:hypothetical protein BYI23_A008520 [Burkholderia sp. YI23]BBP95739.1 hypothetical protein BSFA1_08680 [Burkholderia sp. SFA1]